MMAARTRFINVQGNLIDLSVPKVMGIINVTPDSFHKASRFTKDEEIIKAASRMIEDGADILDIGGFSSRPGAKNITTEEERKRVLGALRLVNREFPEAVLSIDTFRAEIAMEAVLECGAGIINDVSGGEADCSDVQCCRKTAGSLYSDAHEGSTLENGDGSCL